MLVSAESPGAISIVAAFAPLAQANETSAPAQKAILFMVSTSLISERASAANLVEAPVRKTGRVVRIAPSPSATRDSGLRLDSNPTHFDQAAAHGMSLPSAIFLVAIPGERTRRSSGENGRRSRLRPCRSKESM